MAEARQRAGLSGIELARRIGRSNVTVSRWENGASIGEEDLAAYAREVNSTQFLLRYGEAGLGEREQALVAEAEARGFRMGIERVAAQLERIIEQAREAAKKGPTTDDRRRDRLLGLIEKGEATAREQQRQEQDIAIQYQRPPRPTAEDVEEKERRRRSRGAGATGRRGA